LNESIVCGHLALCWFSNEEIAEVLKIPSGTVRSRLHTARQRLKKLLAEREELASQQVVSKRVTP
jgi:hypothetical protein